MIGLAVQDAHFDGVSMADLEPYAGYDDIRQIERHSIRRFMEQHRSYLQGRVLDFGAGKPGTCHEPQPYRDLVDGEYEPYDLGDPAPRGLYDTIMCNQVFQYLDNPSETLECFYRRLETGGHLVMTYTTNWDEVEAGDFWRFTKSGMEKMLRKVSFAVRVHERRAEVRIGNFKFPLGYGLVAVAVK